MLECLKRKRREKFFSLLGGSGGMLPQKILRIEPLKSAEIAFQSTLIGNFFILFYNNFTISFHMNCPAFIVNHSFIYSVWILHLRLRL